MPRPTIVIPNGNVPGMQTSSVHQRMRLGTCEEHECEWFYKGKTGVDDGQPFVHPAGVRCGDTKGCPPCQSPRPSGRLCGTCPPCRAGTANCPCPGRLARSLRDPNRRGHLVPDFANPQYLTFKRAPTIHVGGRVLRADMRNATAISQSEFIDRVAEGSDTYNHIKTRGL